MVQTLEIFDSRWNSEWNKTLQIWEIYVNDNFRPVKVT